MNNTMEQYAKTFTTGFKRHGRRPGNQGPPGKGIASFKVDDPALKIETTIPRDKSKDA